MEGRLDPLFYRLNQSFKNAVYVENIADIKGGKRLPKGHHYIQDNRGYKYLRVKDIQDNDVDYSSLHNINKKTFQILNRYELNFGELFISIAGTIGKVGHCNKLLEDKIILTENAAKIIVKDKSSINPEYLKYILQSDVIQKQIEANYIQTTIPKLGLDRIGKLKIPLPPKDIQQQIIDVMDNAYLDKRAKEKQADDLLTSIDTYILNELGITLPERDTSMEARMFQTTFRQVSGRRFDPNYFSTFYNDVLEEVRTSEFNLIQIGDAVSFIGQGKTPAKDDYCEISEYPIIKVGSYTDQFIDLKKCSYTVKKQMIKAEKDDIFILSAAHQSEYVGQHIKFLTQNPENPTSFVDELICVKANSSLCNPNFLFTLLNTEVFKILINREKSGQTSHIYGKDISKIQIPLPPLAKQQAIGKEANRRRLEARRLSEEADKVLEEARAEIEKRILG